MSANHKSYFIRLCFILTTFLMLFEWADYIGLVFLHL